MNNNDEFKEIKKKIRNAKINNTKIECIKNLKLFAASKFKRTIALTAGITLIATSSVPPMIETKYLNAKTEIDTLGNKTKIEQYGEFENNTSTISYYSAWKKDENNAYKRSIKTYELNKISDEELEELIKNIDNLENNDEIFDILGRKIYEQTETTSNLSDEQLEEKEHIKFVLYDYDKNIYIKKEWPVFTYLIKFLVLLFSVGFSSFPIIDAYYNDKHNIDKLYNIKKFYNSKKIDIDDLTRKLER